MKNILVPLDFSSCSIKAVEYAANLCKVLSGHMTLLHAIQVPALSDIDDETSLEIENEIMKSYEELKEKLPILNEVDHDFKLKFSSILSEIKQIAQYNIDLIVMGTKGATGAKEVFIGSNTYEVIQDASCPVIAVPEDNSLFNLKTIALASDYKRIDDFDDLEPLILLAKKRNAEIHVLHIGQESKISRKELEVGKSQEQYLKSLSHSYHFIEEDDVVHGLNKYLEENRIDMLAIYARKHYLAEKLFHNSVTQKMTFHTKAPLFVLPERSMKLLNADTPLN
ncbi:MAG: universal stress protein [Bacteroidetes bacterium]|nr:universal stress protein [Bacteroidota bacterium]MDA1120394.1 universal stress protein [Bacteroidota bacterium]